MSAARHHQWPTVGKVEKKEDRGCPLVAAGLLRPGQGTPGSVSQRLGPAADSHEEAQTPVRLTLSSPDSHSAMLKQ